VILVSYRAGEALRPGVADDTKLVDAAALGYPASLRAILAAGPDVVTNLLEAASKALRAGTGVVELASVALGPPIPDPDKIICLGLNYKDHAAETGLKLPTSPVLFPKYRNSLIGPVDDIVVPRVATGKVDYEVELAVVIGRRAREVAKADALGYVAGYAAFNDVSARDLQMQTSQWAPGKAVDNFAPMGPGIVPAREIANPQNLMLTTRVNGTQLQHESTSQMIFDIATTIAFITSFLTLEPGDIIATGTPAGVGFSRTPPIALKHGDIVETEIEQIGRLRNRVVFPPDMRG
jgi:2-keto-4-pentenoate hydratase/2-oxohepta-3-ene-1,7-dioic acid hydratase in catechol pathway